MGWHRWLGLLAVGALSGLGTLGCSDDGSGGGSGGSSGSGASSGSGGSAGNGGSSGSGGSAGDGGSSGSGGGTPLGGCDVFPADNPWNTDVSAYPVHPNSDTYVESIGRDRGLHADFGTEWEDAPIGIPYVVVPQNQAPVPVAFDVEDESDPGPYPIPPDAPIEGGPNADGDRHVLVVQQGTCKLFELYSAYPENAGASWSAYSGAVFDLSSNALRPDRWTSADAAGLPILPGLVRYDEVVEAGEIRHALRFTVSTSQDGYIAPATHSAGSGGANDPPMGMRFRMKSSFDCGGLSSEVQVICAALKRYGMFVADNGSDWYISGAHDMRWSDENLSDIAEITGDAFEALDTGPITPW